LVELKRQLTDGKHNILSSVQPHDLPLLRPTPKNHAMEYYYVGHDEATSLLLGQVYTRSQNRDPRAETTEEEGTGIDPFSLPPSDRRLSFLLAGCGDGR